MLIDLNSDNLRLAATNLSKFLSKISEESTFLSSGNKILDIKNFIGQWLLSQDYKELYKIIYNYAEKSDFYGPGSFLYTFNITAKLLIQKLKNDNSLEAFLKNELEILKTKASNPTKNQVDSFINEYKNDFISRLFTEIFNMTSLENKMFLERAVNDKNIIEYRNYYSFDIISEFPVSNWKRKNPHILIIDGLIESVSEIDNILNFANANRLPMVIFARGFSPDVILTLKTNFMRGNLDVVPVRVPYDLEGVNLLNDISIVCGIDIISSIQGQLISSIKPENLEYIEYCDVSNNVIHIKNDKTKVAVKNQIKLLQEIRQNKNIEEIAKLYDKRIKSLFGDALIIKLNKNDKEFLDIDFILKSIKSMILYGIIKNDGFFQEFSKKQFLPSASILMPIKYSLLAADHIFNIKTIC